MHLHSTKTLLGHLLRLLSNGFQTIDKERRDTRYEFHDTTHRHTKEQYFLDVHLSRPTNEHANDHTQH